MSAYAKELTSTIKKDVARLRERGLLTDSQYRSILRQLPNGGLVSSYVDVHAEKDEDGQDIGEAYFDFLAEKGEGLVNDGEALRHDGTSSSLEGISKGASEGRSEGSSKALSEGKLEALSKGPSEESGDQQARGSSDAEARRDQTGPELESPNTRTTTAAADETKSEAPVNPFNIASLASISQDSHDPENPAHPKHPEHEEWARRMGERLGNMALFDSGQSGDKVHGSY